MRTARSIAESKVMKRLGFCIYETPHEFVIRWPSGREELATASELKMWGALVRDAMRKIQES